MREIDQNSECTQWYTKIPNETVTCRLLKGCVPLEARATVDWKFVVTMNIFPRIKDYKNPFHETPTLADYHQLLSSLYGQ